MSAFIRPIGATLIRSAGHIWTLSMNSMYSPHAATGVKSASCEGLLAGRR
jgi:hypothetical protein